MTLKVASRIKMGRMLCPSVAPAALWTDGARSTLQRKEAQHAIIIWPKSNAASSTSVDHTHKGTELLQADNEILNEIQSRRTAAQAIKYALYQFVPPTSCSDTLLLDYIK